MKLHQLRYLCEVVDSNLSVSRAAERLHTSPSGISKQLRILEEELGAVLLTRKSTRITGVTKIGRAALPTIRRILKDVEIVRRVSSELSGKAKGTLTIATTHTHARYALVPTIRRFVREFPEVGLHMRQGTPAQIGQWVASGGVDIGIGTAPLNVEPGLVQIPCYQLKHSVVVPRNHPLLRLRRISLEAVAKCPLITHDPASRLGRLVEEAFAAKGLSCNIVIRAIDTSVMKKYVELGFGIAVLPTVAIDAREDDGLRAIPASHLFKPSTACVIIMRGQSLPDYGRRFVALVTRSHRKASQDRHGE